MFGLQRCKSPLRAFAGFLANFLEAKSSSCSLISETVLPRVAAGSVENWFKMPCKKLRSQFLEDVPVPAFQRPALPLDVFAIP